MLVTPVAMIVASGAFAATAMALAIHQNTSAGSGYRKSLEGWARAGIRNVELTAALLDEFLRSDSLSAAKRVLVDNDLTPVSAACGVGGLFEPNTNHATALDNLKRRCEQFAELGLTHIYAPVGGMSKYVEDDYQVGVQQMRRAGDAAAQYRMTMMAEFVRGSSFISTLTTMLRMTRAAAHANMKPLFDCYHFWSGNNKLEDLDRIQPGEIGHVHFQDVPDMPRELLDNTTRIIPGEGVSPLPTILRKLSDKGYAGPLSVELFLPRFQQGDPFAVAQEVRTKSEAVMRAAGVL
jgi:2-keto-myo-inositol isomerase